MLFSTDHKRLASVKFIITVEAREETMFSGSIRTARKRVKSPDLKNCIVAKKMFLTEQHKLRKLQFESGSLDPGDDLWSSFIFSDEKTFQLGNNERLPVYAPRNCTYEETIFSGAAIVHKNKSISSDQLKKYLDFRINAPVKCRWQFQTMNIFTVVHLI